MGLLAVGASWTNPDNTMFGRILSIALVCICSCSDTSSGSLTPPFERRCASGEYVNEGSCVTCPPGTERLSEDSTLGPNTRCTAVLCGSEERVEANRCTACEPGTRNGAGDDSSGPDTLCESILCTTDQFVLAHSCRECPSGTENTAGDDASGGDTQCEPDSCMTAFGLSCDSFAESFVKGLNTERGDRFGWSVTLSEDVLAVGARAEDSASSGVEGEAFNNLLPDSGAVYVFKRSGSLWRQEAYLKPSNPGLGNIFGYSVAISGDSLAVGAPFESSNAVGVDGDQRNEEASQSGAVYIFERFNTMWTQVAYLKASNTGVGDSFGSSLSFSGDALAVGAPGEDTSLEGDGAAEESGAVYIFARTDSTWRQTDYLKASNAGAGDRFGESVTIHEDTLAVGAPRESSAARGVGGDQLNNDGRWSGAVYVFTKNSGQWTQDAYLKGINTEDLDLFGQSVALWGETIVVGAPGESSERGDVFNNGLGGSGAVYIFGRQGQSWAQTGFLKASTPGEGDLFGYSIDMSQDIITVAAIYESSAAVGVGGDEDDDSALRSGAIYVYRRRPGTNDWHQLAYVKASNTGEGDQFGSSLATDGVRLASGAPMESSAATGVDSDEASNNAPASGAVYIRRISARD